MLSNAKTVTGYKLDCLDGEIGKVKEFYFDDKFWTIRYLVADTGNWLPGRQVLIAPFALVAIVNQDHKIATDLMREQIEKSPLLSTDKPVSRQFEEDYYGYYGWPNYWTGPFTWGFYRTIVRDREQWKDSGQIKKPWDPHLRSSQDLMGHHIQADDGEIGHVEDLIIDDETWAIRYLVVDTRNWWPGQKVLISPRWIESISWGQSKVYVKLSREAVKHSPEYTEEFLITRNYEDELHQHYQRQGYWGEEQPRGGDAHTSAVR